MSVFVQTRGEAGGGVAAHLRCPQCGHLSKSHAQQLCHLAASHPACLDGVAVGRLGNILMYQAGGRLFHCSDCFYTSRDFNKLYKHIIARHCLLCKEEEEGDGDAGKKEESGGGEEKEEDGEKKDVEENQNMEGLKRKREGADEEEEAPQNKQRAPGEEEEKEGEAVAPDRKTSSEGDGGAQQGGAEEEEEEEEKNCVLTYDGALFHCKICGWSHKQRSVSVSHIVRKHEIPKSCASHALAKSREAQGAEEEEAPGLSEELMREEVNVTGKLVGFVSHRYVCLICDWRSKLKGFVLTHIERRHEVARPYRCKECSQSFIVPSRLQQHVRTAHRPGRYACPFCWFRSEFLGGFRRHCSRCNAREEEGGVPGVAATAAAAAGGAGGGGVSWEEADRKETRGMRRRRSLETRGKEEEELDDEEDD
ncbi:chromosome alignment-maintaining phosphoprotein 1-like [Fundulus heteroclitus]|uniref:chromosome alignment-maintaining phosphoprotein 1-like n=1 Tax=Fundulus heteroclitus TaxID=8078 RepID=UPI00165CC094|nr:chromosome alignment-maintaining phosphoprotein 1-like [Fundulus heteroclitus]XP_035983965.1 chromosome alignment-maintaining phosphoprotein 1-like [Fundulus heteroclitus]